MKLELEDNTQEAFQFLMLGAAIVLVIKVMVIGLGSMLDDSTGSEMEQITSHYRKDFLLAEKNVIVIGGMDLFGRLALAFLLSIAAGVIGSVIGMALAKAIRGSALSFAVAGARFGLIIAGSIALYSALFLPPRSAVISDQGVLLRERSSIADAISIPFTKKEVLIHWKEVTELERIEMTSDQGCGVIENVRLVLDGSFATLLEEMPGTSNCRVATNIARERSIRLMEVIRKDHLP